MLEEQAEEVSLQGSNAGSIINHSGKQRQEDDNLDN